jgi:DNA repair exonuclease SbcCD ATPase subunit
VSDITFESIELRNFLSFGNLTTTISLDQRGTTHIIGENLDDNVASGAGKTAVLSALAYALFDKVPSKISKERLINNKNGDKPVTMEVKTTFMKDGHRYVIRRARGVNAGLSLTESGKDITPANSGHFNDKVEEIVGFSYNLFEKIILFNGNTKPFLDFSVGDQRALIEELFRITTLSKKAAALKKMATQTDKDIAVQRSLIKQQEVSNENYHKRVADAKLRVKRWEEQREVDLAKITGDISKFDSIDFETEETLHAEILKMESTLYPVRNTIDHLTATRRLTEREIFPRSIELSMIVAELAKIERDLTKIKNEIGHLLDSKCPYCLQDFSEARFKIAALVQEQAALEIKQSSQEETMTALQAEEVEFKSARTVRLNELDEQISVKQGELTELLSSLNEYKSGLLYQTAKAMHDAKSNMSVIQDRLLKMMGETNPHVEAVKTLESEGEVPVDHQGLQVLLDLQEHQTFLVKLLTDKNSFIRKNIISKTIPFLNKRIGYYTQKLNLPHIVLFQPDMSCEISEHGLPLDHGNLSNGEKKKLNLGLCMAFRDVLTYLHAKVNVLFTDEIDGGSISGNDVDALIGLLKAKAWDDEIGIYIVSHRPEFEGRCDRSIIVRKERGFSTIINMPED